MTKNILCTLFDSITGDWIYSVCIYRGHIFRVYPDGRISAADEEDKRAAQA